jgi:hypothetical protein
MTRRESFVAGARRRLTLFLAAGALCLAWPLAVGRAAELAVATQPRPAAGTEEEASPSDLVPAPAAPEAAAPQKQIPLVKQAPAAGGAGCIPFRVREFDQVWVVSTRCLGCPGGYLPTYQMWRFENGWWQPRSAAEFYATDSPDVVTAFYIHGNRIDQALSFRDGLEVYFQLVGRYEDRPVRFVVWSWPSDQIKGPLKDVRAKSDRSDVDSYYLANFVADIDPSVPVGIVGYSFGARITTGALHVLGGGSMVGYTVPPGPRPSIRVALWAAAVHNHWLVPGAYNGNALPMADAWFNTINCCDPVLQRYRMLDACDDPEALGYAGLAGRNLIAPDLNARFEERNVSNIVGSTHDMRPYLYSSYIQGRTREYVLWYELYSAPQAVPLAAVSQ